MEEIKLLDHGYVKLIESWGSDERIIESARMSTAKGFLGWGTSEKAGDEKLLKFLWDNQHATPFEMAGLIIEVKAPIAVFREWHRHRTQSYNEMSARYIPLPDESYIPTVKRCMLYAISNKQAGRAEGAVELTESAAVVWLAELASAYEHIQKVYRKGLDIGISKELARLPVAVGRYSAMRASANIRNWLEFIKLRSNPAAQWEIRQYSNEVANFIKELFPRTYEVSHESLGLK